MFSWLVYALCWWLLTNCLHERTEEERIDNLFSAAEPNASQSSCSSSCCCMFFDDKDEETNRLCKRREQNMELIIPCSLPKLILSRTIRNIHPLFDCLSLKFFQLVGLVDFMFRKMKSIIAFKKGEEKNRID